MGLHLGELGIAPVRSRTWTKTASRAANTGSESSSSCWSPMRLIRPPMNASWAFIVPVATATAVSQSC